MFALTLLLPLLSFAAFARAQYCQRGSIVLDTQSQCLLSADFNLENCCQVCPVTNATGYFQFCLSVYDLGYATCSQSGSLAARQSACSALGGNVNAGSFMCLLSAGTNKSQSTGWVPTTPLSPSGPQTTPTEAPTEAPTSHAVVVTAPALMFASLLLAYALSH